MRLPILAWLLCGQLCCGTANYTYRVEHDAWNAAVAADSDGSPATVAALREGEGTPPQLEPVQIRVRDTRVIDAWAASGQQILVERQPRHQGLRPLAIGLTSIGLAAGVVGLSMLMASALQGCDTAACAAGTPPPLQRGGEGLTIGGALLAVPGIVLLFLAYHRINPEVEGAPPPPTVVP
jgi:hypothetical protein